MGARCGWLVTSGVLFACALPKVEIDPALGASGRGGASGSGGSSGGGAAMGGSPMGGAAGKGGSGGGSGIGQGGAMDDQRENKCGDYCQTYVANCSASPANTYAGFDDCLATCFTSDWPLGDDVTQPNSIQCRDLHAHLAKTLPDPHCFHSGKVPSDSPTMPAAGAVPCAP